MTNVAVVHFIVCVRYIHSVRALGDCVYLCSVWMQVARGLHIGYSIHWIYWIHQWIT